MVGRGQPKKPITAENARFGGGGGGNDSGQRKPTTADSENERKCSILAVVLEEIGGGSNGTQRKPRNAENERECLISSIVGGG